MTKRASQVAFAVSALVALGLYCLMFEFRYLWYVEAEQATTVVYCGPSIPGVAKQYTAYTNGIPTALAEAIVKQPAMEGLVVPLEQLPEAMKNLRSGTGHISRLYRLVQVKH